jgi:hypothetical protein
MSFMSDLLSNLPKEQPSWRDYVYDSQGPFGDDDLLYNNIFRSGSVKDMDLTWDFYVKNGRMPTHQEYKSLGGKSAGWNNIKHDFEKIIIPAYESHQVATGNKPGIDRDPKSDAFNAYYNDLYSLNEGTGGRALYDRLEQAFVNQANQEIQTADVQYQAQALQQAQMVKAITDQVRAERMARLRAGMSESQIANQDIQMLMANVNALNQNAQMLNQQRIDARTNANLAKDQAYMAYLEQANARGQNATAMYAADSGNAQWNAIQYAREAFGKDFTPEQYKQAFSKVINGK